MADVAERAGVAVSMSHRWIKWMHSGEHDELRVHICGWSKGKGNHWRPVYAAGPGEDAPLTERKLTRTEEARNYLAKLRKDRTRLAAYRERRKEYREKYKAQAEAKKWVDKHLTQGVQDPLLAAFYGMRTSA